MRKLPKADRYYLIWNSKYTKTHLLYFSREFGNFVAHQACIPNMPVEVKHGCCWDGWTGDCTPEDASIMDEYYNELTCSTCLKMARGDIKQQIGLEI